jgi:phosphomethylpyrimidine synthase
MTKPFTDTLTTSNELLTRDPLPASQKIYLQGEIHKDIRVPIREIALSNDTKLGVYDTSGFVKSG